MNRYTAVWDDEVRLPLNGAVVLTKERFACDWRSTNGSVICYQTTSADGVYYNGVVLELPQQATGSFAHPIHTTQCRAQFRRHPPTTSEPWVRMEYIRWESDTEELSADDLCDILLLPVPTPKRAQAKKSPKAKPKPKRTQK